MNKKEEHRAEKISKKFDKIANKLGDKRKIKLRMLLELKQKKDEYASKEGPENIREYNSIKEEKNIKEFIYNLPIVGNAVKSGKKLKEAIDDLKINDIQMCLDEMDFILSNQRQKLSINKNDPGRQ